MFRFSSFCLPLLLLLFVNPVCAQRVDTIFRQPLDLPVLLSATFAELRANHLHSGIDFRTQGTTGHKVYACEQGYVSRIAVSPTGYGHALYITHPNGYTTVYAHLDAFNDDIADYVKQRQYHLNQFAVNIFPNATHLPVTRGEVIAFSGNTGSSGGPHLHFEVRDTKTETPINPLQFGFGVKDNIAPIMRRLTVYPIGKGSTVNGQTERLVLPLEKIGKTYRITGGKKLKAVGKVAFGIDAYDQTSGSANRCGPYSIRLRIDSFLMFSQTMTRFSFDETRYINSLIDYDAYINSRIRYNRMYIEPNNQLSVYDRQHNNNGVASFSDSGTHTAQVIIRDFHNNSSQLNFTFDYAPDTTHATPPLQIPITLTDLSESMYKQEFTHIQPGLRVVIPADALYDEIDFTCAVSKPLKGLYSNTYNIHHPGTPLHKAITIEIAADSLPEHLREKALLVLIEPSGRRSSAGGAYGNGLVSAESRMFGQFAIGADTIPPRITPVNIKMGANMSGIPSMRFKISDDFSGIASYNGRIDDQWALFEYDAKNSLLYYRFDADRLTKNTQHTLELKLTDNKGNTATYNAKFTW